MVEIISLTLMRSMYLIDLRGGAIIRSYDDGVLIQIWTGVKKLFRECRESAIPDSMPNFTRMILSLPEKSTTARRSRVGAHGLLRFNCEFVTCFPRG